MFSAAPNAITTSESASSRCAVGEAKPPEIPTANGSPANSPFATAEVARIAPLTSPSRRSAGPAPDSTAPRPAMIAGRSAPASAAAAAETSLRTGASEGAEGGSTSSHAAAWTSSGSISTTVRRSTTARRTARVVSATADEGPCTRSATAPTDSTSASWSILKFERICAAGVSAASRITGVRLLADSVSPVIAFVSPGPWCTDATPSRPLTRA